MIDGEQQFKEYIRSRLFGIVAVVENAKDSSEEFPMCSGVIIESRGYHVLVTVAHYLQDLKRWHDKKRLVNVALSFHCDGLGDKFVKLDLNKNHVFFNENIDIGFVILSPGVIERTRSHGGKAIKAESTSFDGTLDNFVLVGNPASHAKLTTATIASGVSATWELWKLADLEIACVPLKYDRIRDDEATFKFTPITGKGIDDYVGTSGGPIFGYKNGALISDYCFFAIQSGQGLVGSKVTHLFATSAWLAVELINDHIDKLDATR